MTVNTAPPTPFKCLIVDDDPIAITLLTHYVEQSSELQIAGTALNATGALRCLNQNKIDVMLLDVEMPGMNGLELLENLPYRPAVILISARDKYAVEAFNFDVVDYIVKPPSFERFLKAVDKAITLLGRKDKTADHQNLFIKFNSEFVSIPLHDILYCEAERDYVQIFTPAKRYFTLATMKELESKLPSKDFQRIHRSFIVRLDKISRFGDEYVIISEKIIPIGVTYKKSLSLQGNFL